MAVFKRVNDQYTVQIKAFASDPLTELHVGDVISTDLTSHEVFKIEELGGIQAAMDGGNLVGIIAQGDAVTEKTGPAHKTYTTSDIVDMKNYTDEEHTKTIVIYVVKDVSNVQF